MTTRKAVSEAVTVMGSWYYLLHFHPAAAEENQRLQCCSCRF